MAELARGAFSACALLKKSADLVLVGSTVVIGTRCINASHAELACLQLLWICAHNYLYINNF